VKLNTAQKIALDQCSRQFSTTVYTGGFSAFVQEQLLDPIEIGNVGITSIAYDVDALAKDGGHFAQDADTTTGLTFGYRAGRLYNGKAIVDVVAGTVALTASTTNYVECSRAGVVSKNTVGFTSGAIPLYVVVTGVSTITSTTNKKSLLGSVPNGGITGDMLSAVAAIKNDRAAVGTVNATTTVTKKLIAPCAGSITGLAIAVNTTVATSDVNYWTVSAVNKGASGAGSTALLLATDANTTKTTGGSGLTNYVTRYLSLHGTPANLVVAKGDVIIFTFTKTAAAADLVELEAQLEVTPST
jgi:hypothetical protein